MTTAERLLPQDTRTALQSLSVKDCSRSLYFDRFSRPELDKDARKQFFTDGFGAHRSSVRADNWVASMRLDPAHLLFAQVQSRLMVNMAGGVMENAGLCLDRFGLPYIPGSAVKACARRMAIHQLLARSADSLASSDELASFLAEIALTFGWTDDEWRSGRKHRQEGGKMIKTSPHSDFWWVMAADTGDHSADAERSARWSDVSEKAAAVLFKTLHFKPRDSEKPLAPQLPNFAGTASFLPAWPVKASVETLPAGAPPKELGKLELDVVTCHHGKYYKQNPDYASAPDTEDPVPVVFPAIAPAHVFVFSVLTLRGVSPELATKARTWLAEGLATFGLGAKTAAGYGWFVDVSPQVMPWWKLEVAVAQLKAEHRNFATYPDTQKDEVVLNLSEQPDTCRTWAETDPTSFEPFIRYANSQGIQLV